MGRQSSVALHASFYDLPPATDVDGKPFDFSSLKGKVVYATNVASRCGYTKENYELFRKLQDKEGLHLLLFPSGNFGGQEYRSDAEIKDFVAKQCLADSSNVHVLTKGDVVGPKAQPAWKLFKEVTQAPEPNWNFEGKYVITKTGEIRHVPRGTTPESVIDAALAE